MSQQKLAQRALGIIMDYLKCNDCRVRPVYLMWPAHPGLGDDTFTRFWPFLTTYLPQVDICEGTPLLLQGRVYHIEMDETKWL